MTPLEQLREAEAAATAIQARADQSWAELSDRTAEITILLWSPLCRAANQPTTKGAAAMIRECSDHQLTALAELAAMAMKEASLRKLVKHNAAMREEVAGG